MEWVSIWKKKVKNEFILGSTISGRIIRKNKILIKGSSHLTHGPILMRWISAGVHPVSNAQVPVRPLTRGTILIFSTRFLQSPPTTSRAQCSCFMCIWWCTNLYRRVESRSRSTNNPEPRALIHPTNLTLRGAYNDYIPFPTLSSHRPPHLPHHMIY